jgi:hypothetical protein
MVQVVICLLGFHFATPPTVAGSPDTAKPSLPPAVEKEVRNTVYPGKLILAHPTEGKYAFSEIVVLPDAIEAAYKKHPTATLDVLLAIAEGGRPWDSVTAIAFAMALVVDPAVAPVVISVFKEETYDDVDKDWEVTPRQHWLGKVKKQIHKAKAKK